MTYVETLDGPQGAPIGRYGRYEILKKLATGGMGEVYLARSVGAAGFRKHVVIKCILPHLVEHGDVVDALVREAKMLVLLDHPNIVQVLDLGGEGQDYFMAMEFVQGYNLATIAHYCAQKRLLIPAPACVAVALGVLAGLEYAHELKGPGGERHNIIHRDVSPQNVMISRDGRVKLTDFGIAKVLSVAGGEFTTSLKGKFRYMAPEAVEGGRIDQRYDLFAVGILLFEALCRRHLFGGRNDVDILKQVRMARVPDIARYHPGLAPELVEVTTKALARDMEHRYQGAGDFAAALRSAIAPVSESDALVQLRAFVAELYERPDFPLNKPKMPNLQNGQLEVTRSIVLRSHVLEEGQAAQASSLGGAEATVSSAGTGRLAIGLITAVLALLVGVVGYLAYVMQRYRPPPMPEVVRILPRPQPQTPVRSSPPADRQAVHPAAETTQARTMDATTSGGASAAQDRTRTPRAASQPRRTKRVRTPTAVSFTPEVGRRYFGRYGAKIRQCLDRWAKPGEQIRLGVISEIRGDGSVAKVTLDPPAQNATSLGKCITQVASTIQYPRHDKSLITYKQPVMVRMQQGSAADNK